MYVSFHGVIFDPESLVYAKCWDNGVALCFDARRGPSVVVPATDQLTPEKIYEELVGILQDAGQLYTPAEPDPPIEMSDLELGFLMQAADEGYKYIARDYNGQLFAYKDKPHKDGQEWMAYAPAAEPERMCDELFDFVDFDDAEPAEIAELLGR